MEKVVCPGCGWEYEYYPLEDEEAEFSRKWWDGCPNCDPKFIVPMYDCYD